jgi:pyridoxamine 5'-phosphate oxidase
MLTAIVVAPAGTQAHGQAEQFTAGSLHRRDLDPKSPIPQFHAWFTQAQNARLSSSSGTDAAAAETAAVPHPETCTLSTASLPSGRVSARMVYLKELDASGGFVVYTNLGTSRKAADLASNPHASLVFWWEALQRQVRVEGRATRLTQEESQTYFDTRVRGSRLGAWASRQSKVLQPAEGGDGTDDGRAQLEGWVKEAEDRFQGEEKIPVPEFWGGLRIVPDRVEFWQGRESRLHDRFVYEQQEGDSTWTLQRLSP